MTERKRVERVGLVVDIGTLVAVVILGTVSLIGVDSDSVGAVDGELIKIGSQTVSVGVIVRKQSSLQHLVIRRLDARNHVGWRKGALLHFGEVVLGVSV